MLNRLQVSNFILIDDLMLDFSDGFSIITGETGAGKSILLGAIGMLLGNRASASVVRAGKEVSTVVGSFDKNPHVLRVLGESGIFIDDCDDEIIIRRVVYSSGKSKAYINDQQVSGAVLRNIAGYLVEIHGQFDQLLRPSAHREVLDNYAGLGEKLHKLSSLFSSWQAKLNQLNDMRQRRDMSLQNKEYLESVLNELRELDPKRGEEEELSERRKILSNQVKIAQSIESTDRLVNIIKEHVWEVSSNLNVVSEFMPERVKLAMDAFERMEIEVNELSAEIAVLSQSLDCEPDELEKIEQRLYALRGMARKHTCLVDDLEDLLIKFENDLRFISHGDEEIEELEREVLSLREEYIDLAQQLSEDRKKYAVEFSALVNKQLCDLKLARAKVMVKFTDLAESMWNSFGTQAVEFYVQTNDGMAPGALSKIASGGERSRIMLAIKVVLANSSKVGTIIFDEIDSGVGGAVATAIGKKLREISNSVQVLAVTHSPQVAVNAHVHMHISKNSGSNSDSTTDVSGGANAITKTRVVLLSEEQSKCEIARMLSGDNVTDEAVAAAEKLMENVA